MIAALPNLISMMRILAVPVTVGAIGRGAFDMAFVLFALAGLSDALDGAIARLANARTRLGQWLDPLADKLLLVAVYSALTWEGLIPLWLTLLVAGRDAMIAAGALWLTRRHRGYDISPLRISKLNTALQVVLVVWMLGSLVFGLEWQGVDYTLFGLTALTTGLSGMAYAAGVIMDRMRRG